MARRLTLASSSVVYGLTVVLYHYVLTGGWPMVAILGRGPGGISFLPGYRLAWNILNAVVAVLGVSVVVVGIWAVSPRCHWGPGLIAAYLLAIIVHSAVSIARIALHPRSEVDRELWVAVPQCLLLLICLGLCISLVRWHRRLRNGAPTCRCGYNLTGNVSGVCPECGRAVSVQ